MPIVNVQMYSGRTQKEKDRLATQEGLEDDNVSILETQNEDVNE